MARVSSIIIAGMLLALGLMGPGSSIAIGNPLSNFLSGQLAVRSLVNGNLPGLPPVSPPSEIGVAEEELSGIPNNLSLVQQGEPATEVQFKYDAVEPVLDEQVVLTQQTAAHELPPIIDGPVSMVSEAPPALPSARVMSSSVDPFFGGVTQLLGAGPDQPFLRLEAIRPPAAPQMINGQSMVAAPTESSVIPLASLPALPDAEVLVVRTHQAGTMPGRAVLLADARAMLLPSVEWRDETVMLQLPPLRVKQPTLARVFVARPDGVVVDYFDFVLVPRNR